jgi:hypothetical protein
VKPEPSLRFRELKPKLHAIIRFQSDLQQTENTDGTNQQRESGGWKQHALITSKYVTSPGAAANSGDCGEYTFAPKAVDTQGPTSKPSGAIGKLPAPKAGGENRHPLFASCCGDNLVAFDSSISKQYSDLSVGGTAANTTQ